MVKVIRRNHSKNDGKLKKSHKKEEVDKLKCIKLTLIQKVFEPKLKLK